MAERKPSGMSFETWIDRQIREAEERGAFDDLPGAGKPLTDRDQRFSMDRWVADWARREGMDTEALLPEPLRLRKEIERLPEAVGGFRSERAVRDLVEDLNRRIVDVLRRPSELPVVVGPVNADAVVEQWRATRKPPGANTERGTAVEPPAPRVPWWRRILRRGRRT